MNITEDLPEIPMANTTAAVMQNSVKQSLLPTQTTIGAPATPSGSRSYLRTHCVRLKPLFSHDSLHVQSPLAMMVCLILGGLIATSHYFFYRHLDATIVQTKNDQEWALRFGNAFALATKTALVAAVGIVYTQHIWTIFRWKKITIEGINAVIAAPNDVFAMLNGEMWLKNLAGTFIAGLLWFLPLVITILPPASLSVHSASSNHSIQSQVSVPIYVDSIYAELTNELQYAGTRLARLIWASATNVHIIPMDAPFPSVSYSVDFYGPSLNCSLEKFNRQSTTQLRVIEVDNFPKYPDNILQIYTSLNDKYIQCALYNTSFHTYFSFKDGTQSTSTDTKFINPLKYPNSTTDTRDIPSFLPYQGWMDPISDMLRGYILLNSSSDDVRWDSNIGLTGLVYSSDVQPMLTTKLPDDPSIGAKQLFRPLEDLLEEFSVNLTISLFSSSVLSPSVYNTTVTISSPVDIYAYSQENLLVPYLASLACSLLAVFVGVRAFRLNGKSQNVSFSSILSTTRGEALDKLVGDDSSDALPLNPRIAETKLQFAAVKEHQKSHWGFQLK